MASTAVVLVRRDIGCSVGSFIAESSLFLTLSIGCVDSPIAHAFMDTRLSRLLFLSLYGGERDDVSGPQLID